MAKPFNGVANLDVRDSIPACESYLAGRAPEGAPNVLVLYDNSGLAAWSPFGGRILKVEVHIGEDLGLDIERDFAAVMARD
jgi:hypothetical protein